MLRKILFLTLFLCCSGWIAAQDSLQCQDVVYVKGGSVFRGKITSYDPNDLLRIVTWSGVDMQISSNTVLKIIQECSGLKSRKEQRDYTFRERGWYHFSRAALTFSIDNVGYSLQHSSGYKFNRFLSVGAGIGLENYTPGGNDPVTIPLFAEIRGYLTQQRISPFYALGAGWSVIGKEQRAIDFWGWENNIQEWKGGWLAQGQVGYRIGNHFMTFIGIRLQRLTNNWDNSAWNGGYGTDRHLKKRVELGIGLLL